MSYFFKFTKHVHGMTSNWVFFYKSHTTTQFVGEKSLFQILFNFFSFTRNLNQLVFLGPALTEEGETPESDRQKLQRNWARFGQWYKLQPLNAIKSYFGIRVGLYFAWLGTYNFMLIFAAIVGLLCFIYGALTINIFAPAQETCDINNTRRFYMCPQCDKVSNGHKLTKYFIKLNNRKKGVPDYKPVKIFGHFFEQPN